MNDLDSIQKAILSQVESGRLSPESAADLLRSLPRAHQQSEPCMDRETPQKNDRIEIAVIGMSGRFPDAEDIDSFWQNLKAGMDSVREVPEERNWPSKASGEGYCRQGGFLGKIDQFDPLFFDISPREAELMDPQQRLFLEESWRAFEDAGYSKEMLDDAECGVFAGASPGDYKHLLKEAGHVPEAFTLVGTNEAILSARISYLLNLKGPSLTVNTACSSSLVALCLACDQLAANRCDLALAGGVSIYSTPDFHESASRAGILSKEGRCKAFDASADGFVPGEAVGVVILKRLEDALRDGDRVHGVIQAWGSNQDGHSHGITAPNAVSQTALIRKTYERFAIDPSAISYIETHGTGTKLGDPIEIAALTEVYANSKTPEKSCFIGSVKTNIGHPFAAAGVVGLIKILCSLRHQTLVPSLHFNQENPHLGLNQTPFSVATKVHDWSPPGGTPRQAALNSFGFSGTNAHICVREHPSTPGVIAPDSKEYHLFPVSAKTPTALNQRLRDLVGWLKQHANIRLKDLSHTLCTRSTHYGERTAFVASTLADLIQQMELEDISHASRKQAGPQIKSLKNHVQTDLSNLEDLAALYCSQEEIPFKNGFRSGSFVPLPGHPFERESYWFTKSIIESRKPTQTSNPLTRLETEVLKFTAMIRALEEYARPRLLEALLEMGLERALVSGSGVMSDTMELLEIPAGQQRVFEAMLDILQRSNAIKRSNGGGLTLSTDSRAFSKQISTEAPLIKDHEQSRRYLPLLNACLRHLPDILRNRIPITQVMFPEGSMHLVEPTYHGDPIRDYFNEQLSEKILSEMRRRKEGSDEPVVIMEIGAGTGGTSAVVLENLGRHPSRVDYLYTDISPRFIRHGEERFASDRPWMTFRTFDIEQSIASQDLKPASVDILFASNVVHAVKDIGETLAHLAGLLKPGGILILNEITSTNDLTTLTFGLTPGWWRFTDNAHRVPHSPLLDADHWKNRLADIGYHDIAVDPLPFEEPVFRQMLITAKAPHRAAQKPEARSTVRTKEVAPPDVGIPSGNVSREQFVMNLLQGIIGETVKLDPRRISPDKTFETFGVDSLVVMELTRKLENHFGPVPSTLLFEHITTRKLSQYFLEHHPEQVEAMNRLPESGEVSLLQNEKDLSKTGDQVSSTTTDQDIAIIGMAGRYPNSPDLNSFWENLCRGKNCIGEIPADRWDWRSTFDQEGGTGKSYSRWGGFLENIDRFDPLFFNIAPRDSHAMDPQERLFLETTWHVMEDAGYTPSRLQSGGKLVGVFAGVMNNDYGQVACDLQGESGHPKSRTAFWSVANRVSYVFDFHGPSMAIDSACSSSLTAIHLACNSLRLGECSFAIAGGVNLILHPSKFAELSRLGMLASDDRCKPFGAEADGFVDGEGVGAVLLRPLKDAIEAGDPIHAIIKASSVNAGGKTSGYTVPNPNAQADLIHASLTKSKLRASDISYVETHGTGTILGDPIEMAALTQAFHRSGGRGHRCAVGSVKSNIGHLESAAGIASVTKVLLQMKHRMLAPSIHCDQLNPKIAFENSPFYVNRRLGPWKPHEADGILRAGVSSFGAGGANAHLLLEQAPLAEGCSTADRSLKCMLLSARTLSSLGVLINRHLQVLDILNENELPDLCFTLQTGRVPQHFTLAIVGRDREDFKNQLLSKQRSLTEADCLTPDEAADLADEPAPPRLAPPATEEEWHRLARLWIHGHSLPWENCYVIQPRRMAALPLYPFEGKSYWIKTPEEHSRKVSRGSKTQSFGEVSPDLSWRLSAADLLVRDHSVRDTPVVPGVGYLSMLIRKQSFNGLSCSFRDVQWLSPCPVEADKDLSLQLEKDGHAFSFTYRDARNQILCRGKWNPEPETQPVPIRPIQLSAAKPRRHFNRWEVDGLFQSVGIRYGAYFKTLHSAEIGQMSNGIGQLKRPKGTSSAWECPLIHPGMLDGALQMVGCLMASDPEPMLPYSIGSITFLRPVADAVQVHAMRTSPGSFDMDLVDEEGNLCVAIRDFVVRKIPDTLDDFYYVPRWIPLDPEEQETINETAPGEGESILVVSTAKGKSLAEAWIGEHSPSNARLLLIPPSGFKHVDAIEEALSHDEQGSIAFDRIMFLGLLGSCEDTPASLDAAQDQGVHSLLSLLQYFQRNSLFSKRPHFHLITNNAHACDTEDPIEPWGASMIGLCKSVAREFPDMPWHLLDLLRESSSHQDPYKAWGLEGSAKTLSGIPGRDLAFRGGRVYQRLLCPLKITDQPGTQIRHQGVYVIAGGAGGIGYELSRHLAGRYAARLVWIGRSDAEQHAEKMDTIRALGGDVLYVTCDITVPEAVLGAVNLARATFGGIHGVIHSAIILKDQSLQHLQHDTLDEVLAVKSKGAQNLFHATRSDALDFFLFFSSGQSFVCNAGQASYSAACTFKDAYAGFMRRQSTWPVKVIHWGYWGTVGIVSDETTQRRMHERGILSISPEDGMKAVEQVLNTDVFQTLPMRARQEAKRMLGIDMNHPCRIPASPRGGRFEWNGIVHSTPAESLTAFKIAYEKLQMVGRYQLLLMFQSQGLFESDGVPHRREDIHRRLVGRHGTEHEKLIDAFLEILVRAELIIFSKQTFRVSHKINNGLMDQLMNVEGLRQDLRAEYPSIIGFSDLLDRCVSVWADVLQGIRPATDALFPSGDTGAVHQIYHDNPIADWCNQLCSETVAEAVRQHVGAKQNRPLRILEIGAGTGGTSKVVLRRMKDSEADLEYVYSDISTTFLKFGKMLSGEFPFVTTTILDVSLSKHCHVWSNSFDIIIAANVLHATRDLRCTLRNVKGMLRHGGLLILNELTAKQDFATMTFGMLKDWWPTDGIRIPHSPLLSIPLWKQLCREEGFVDFHWIRSASSHGDLGQNILVCASDGLCFVPPMDAENAHSEATTPMERSERYTTPQQHANSTRILSASTESRTSVISCAESVLNIVSGVLEISPEELDPDVPHHEFGVDSILAVEMVEKINLELGIRLQVTDFFNYSTLNELIRHIDGLVPEDPDRGRTTTTRDQSEHPSVLFQSRNEASDAVPVHQTETDTSGTCSRDQEILNLFHQVYEHETDIEIALKRLESLEGI